MNMASTAVQSTLCELLNTLNDSHEESLELCIEEHHNLQFIVCQSHMPFELS